LHSKWDVPSYVLHTHKTGKVLSAQYTLSSKAVLRHMRWVWY